MVVSVQESRLFATLNANSTLRLVHSGPTPKSMDGLIKSLPNVLRAAGDAPEVSEAAALAAWKHVAGDGLKDHAVPLRLENRNLIIAVADAVWRTQLETMRGQLLFRVNSILGQPIVSRIQFVIDPRVASAKVELKKEIERPLENEAPLELWSAANAIQDKQLRKKFLRAAVSSIRRRESKPE